MTTPAERDQQLDRRGARTALITGGGSGIGQALARDLLELGWSVALAGRRRARLEAVADSLAAPDRVLLLTGDTAADGDVRSWVASTLDRFGSLDAAVANAGLATTGYLEEDNAGAWREMVLTNVLGPALLVHHAQHELERVSGRVVIVGSVAGMVPTPGNLYGATKYAVTGLAENLRRALTDKHVGVTLIAPGRVETPFWDDLGGLPEGPMLTSNDISRAIVFALTQPAGVDVNTLAVRPFEAGV